MQAAVTDRNKLPGIQLGGRGNGVVLVFMGIGLFGLVWFLRARDGWILRAAPYRKTLFWGLF